MRVSYLEGMASVVKTTRRKHHATGVISARSVLSEEGLRRVWPLSLKV